MGWRGQAVQAKEEVITIELASRSFGTARVALFDNAAASGASRQVMLTEDTAARDTRCGRALPQSTSSKKFVASRRPAQNWGSSTNAHLDLPVQREVDKD